MTIKPYDPANIVVYIAEMQAYAEGLTSTQDSINASIDAVYTLEDRIPERALAVVTYTKVLGELMKSSGDRILPPNLTEAFVINRLMACAYECFANPKLATTHRLDAIPHFGKLLSQRFDMLPSARPR